MSEKPSSTPNMNSVDELHKQTFKGEWPALIHEQIEQRDD